MPPIPPEITFEPLPPTQEAMMLAYEVKRDAMKQHVEKRWDWCDEYQLKVHKSHFESKPFIRVDCNGGFSGVLAFQRNADHFRFGEFYLKRQLRNKGTGTRILNHCLAISDAVALPVRLEFLKWNPVESLYKRAGFMVTDQSDIHFFLERPPTFERS